MPSQQSRSDVTRDMLLSAFRQSLLDHGLEATTTASVLAQTGLSKGALYHHFASKTEIVEAIYRAESHGAIKRAVGRVSAKAPPLERLKRACVEWLIEVRNPDVARILFEIGPAALGVVAAQRIENEFSLALFEGLLAEVDRSGALAIAEPTTAARLLNALMAELAMIDLSRRTGKGGVNAGRLIEATLKGLEVPR
jgi:AcrR family transcriptional regulator